LQADDKWLHFAVRAWQDNYPNETSETFRQSLPSYLAKVMPPEGVVEQFVFMDGPEEVPLEQGDVVGQLLGAQYLQVDVHTLGGALLLLQLGLRNEQV